MYDEFFDTLPITAHSEIDVSDIVFDRAFRAACEQNTCGFYNRCWSCPPDAGDIDELIAYAKSFSRAHVFQTISPLEDSFDIEGMADAAKKHNVIVQKVLDYASANINTPFLLMGAGSCCVCDTCAKREDLPCRFPQRAVKSLEAHGIAVYQLAPACGMNYINGANTVTFFGALLF